LNDAVSWPPLLMIPASAKCKPLLIDLCFCKTHQTKESNLETPRRGIMLSWLQYTQGQDQYLRWQLLMHNAFAKGDYARVDRRIGQFAGAAQSLGAVAILVNPWNVTEVAASICYALDMPADEREKRHLVNFKHVTTHTSQEWAATFVSALNDTIVESPA
ncbi:hypothetical protein PIB30_004677, partial [Stylosanthes scabra]|nr:hypothetical protein [Stylosanthes scabra]